MVLLFVALAQLFRYENDEPATASSYFWCFKKIFRRSKQAGTDLRIDWIGFYFFIGSTIETRLTVFSRAAERNYDIFRYGVSNSTFLFWRLRRSWRTALNAVPF